jgi:hypothetical protein
MHGPHPIHGTIRPRLELRRCLVAKKKKAAKKKKK